MQSDACRDLGGAAAAGGDDRIVAFRAGEPLDRELVLDRDDRAPMRVTEAGCRGVAIGDDQGQAPAPGIREDAELRGACPEHEEAHHTAILAMGPEVPDVYAAFAESSDVSMIASSEPMSASR